jgi:hypothetical protein
METVNAPTHLLDHGMQVVAVSKAYLLKGGIGAHTLAVKNPTERAGVDALLIRIRHHDLVQAGAGLAFDLHNLA